MNSVNSLKRTSVVFALFAFMAIFSSGISSSAFAVLTDDPVGTLLVETAPKPFVSQSLLQLVSAYPGKGYEKAIQACIPSDSFSSAPIISCQQETVNAPAKPNFFQRLIRYFKSKPIAPCPQAPNACILDRIIPKLEILSHTEAYFTTVTLDDFNALRSLLSGMKTVLDTLPDKALKNQFQTRINRLCEIFDPYGLCGKLAEDRQLTEMGIKLFAQNEKITDIREIALVSDLTFNPQVQKKVNEFLRNKAKADTLLNQSPILANIKARDWARNALSPFTYLGTRIPKLSEVRISLKEKTDKLRQNPEANQNLQLTADETWLLDHDTDKNGLITDLVKRVDADRTNHLFDKSISYFSSQEKAASTVLQLALKSRQTGDILFESPRRKGAYKAKANSEEFFSKLLRTGGLLHSGLMLRPETETPKTFQLWDNPSIDPLDLGDAYVTTGFRINLDQLLNPNSLAFFKTIPTAKNIKEFLKQKKQEYGAKYEAEIRGNYGIPEDPHSNEEALSKDFKVRNTPDNRMTSILNPRNWFESRKKRNLRERVIRARETAVAKKQLPNYKEEQEQEELCSEFALKEWVRFATFMERELKQEYAAEMARAHFSGDLFDIHFGEKIHFSGYHPGKLVKLLKSLKSKGIVEEIPPSSTLFAP